VVPYHPRFQCCPRCDHATPGFHPTFFLLMLQLNRVCCVTLRHAVACCGVCCCAAGSRGSLPHSLLVVGPPMTLSCFRPSSTQQQGCARCWPSTLQQHCQQHSNTQKVRRWLESGMVVQLAYGATSLRCCHAEYMLVSDAVA
jgi:hypothetical protein